MPMSTRVQVFYNMVNLAIFQDINFTMYACINRRKSGHFTYYIDETPSYSDIEGIFEKENGAVTPIR